MLRGETIDQNGWIVLVEATPAATYNPGMKATVTELLASFDQLPMTRSARSHRKIMIRPAAFPLPPLTDEMLVEIADSAFVKLDTKSQRMADPHAQAAAGFLE